MAQLGSLVGSLKSAGAAAFMNCKNLKTVSLGNGLTTIEKKAFYNCKKLRKLNICKVKLAKNMRALFQV